MKRLIASRFLGQVMQSIVFLMGSELGNNSTDVREDISKSIDLS